VEAVTPLYIGKTDWLNRDSREKKQALIFGLAPENPALRIPELEADRGKLLRPDGLFFDTLSKKAAGPVAQVVAKDGYYDTELRGKRAVVNGLFTMGLTFAADINLLTSASNFKTWFPDQSNDDIQLGVIQLQPGVSREQVQATLASFLDPSVRVLTLQQLEAVEVDHWRNNTSFGLIFNLGVLVGLIVGGIIVYQILYSDVSDHLPEYATMKAMGYSDRFVVGIIVQESVLLAALAFVPSLVLSIGLYAVLANSTSLLIAMTAQRAVAVFALTLTMAAGSGWLATGKLRRLDPADIF
jgi:putative ABC transport system permease protein